MVNKNSFPSSIFVMALLLSFPAGSSYGGPPEHKACEHYDLAQVTHVDGVFEDHVEEIEGRKFFHTTRSISETPTGETARWYCEKCRTLLSSEDAEASLRRDTQIDPNNAYAWSKLGVALEDKGDWGNAETALRRAIQLKPEDAFNWGSLARVLHRAGDDKGSHEAFQHAQELEKSR